MSKEYGHAEFLLTKPQLLLRYQCPGNSFDQDLNLFEQ
jgi:hypothetical protein